MKKSNRFSIIIPLYNKGPYISRAINSVLAQTHQDFEIVVVYRISSDDGLKIIEKYFDPRIRVIHQKQSGVSDARNFGILMANSDFVAFLDADDEWSPNFLEIINELISKYPGAGAYGTAYDVCNCKGEIMTPNFLLIPGSSNDGLITNYFASGIRSDYLLSNSALCIKKEIFNKIKMYKIDAPFGEDVDIIGRIAIHYPIAFSALVSARYHEDVKNRATIEMISSNQEPFVVSGREALSNNYVKNEMILPLVEYIIKLELRRVQYLIAVGDKRTAIEILNNCETRVFVGWKVMLILSIFIPKIIYKKIICVKNNISKNNSRRNIIDQ